MAHPIMQIRRYVPPSGGSLEIGNLNCGVTLLLLQYGSPFGGIPRNWKLYRDKRTPRKILGVPPSGGSLEIGNWISPHVDVAARLFPLRGDP